jgi:hypothetical protein
MIKNILQFQSPEEHYEADVCIVWCFDHRFAALLALFLKRFEKYDLVNIAGGAKALAGDASPERDFVLGQIKASIRLHHTKRIALMLHRECGAYGMNFPDKETERDYYVGQLATAKRFLAGEIPGVPIDIYFGDFNGLHPIE